MDNHFYKDKVCVVTGASSGVGYAITKLLLDEEAIVYALDRDKVPLFGVISINCDLSNKESIDSAFLNIPDEIDSFFGTYQASGTRNNFNDTFIMDFIANKYITDTYLKKRMTLGGSICYLTSTSGRNWNKYSDEYIKYMNETKWDKMLEILKDQVNPNTSGVVAYPLAMRALNYYASVKSLEFARKGIRVNTVSPAATNSLIEREFQAGGFGALCGQTGVANRVASLNEVAYPILFINSNLASYISGTCLDVDYGNTALLKTSKREDNLDQRICAKKEEEIEILELDEEEEIEIL